MTIKKSGAKERSWNESGDHTQGPWLPGANQYITDATGEKHEAKHVGAKSRGVALLLLAPGVDPDGRESEANLRLICAAPDLLKAAWTALDLAQQARAALLDGKKKEIAAIPELCDQAQTEIEAAIAKAVGQ